MKLIIALEVQFIILKLLLRDVRKGKKVKWHVKGMLKVADR